MVPLIMIKFERRTIDYFNSKLQNIRTFQYINEMYYFIRKKINFLVIEKYDRYK